MEKEIFPQLREKINARDQAWIARLARNRVLEPFEGKAGLEAVQAARSKLEQGVSRLKAIGGRFRRHKLVAGGQAKLEELIAQAKTPNPVTRLWQELDARTRPLQEIARHTASKAQKQVMDLIKDAAAKGFELLLFDESQDWILRRSAKVLNREIMGFREIKNLSDQERETLLQALYPYDSPISNDLLKGFDAALNLGLGVLVATNLPGTGLAAAAANMVKTLFKAANRINIMSAVYGLKVANPAALYQVTGQILASLADWETNPSHRPLDPQILQELYSPGNLGNRAHLRAMLAHAFKKEAYIAIPGVGMISLGKIQLDDIKLDLTIQHLVQDFVQGNRLAAAIEANALAQAQETLTAVYQTLWDQRPQATGVKNREFLRQLDQEAIALAQEVLALPPAQRAAWLVDQAGQKRF